MPIIFVFCGILLLCILFKMIKIDNAFLNVFAIVFLSIFELSFFIDYVEIEDVYFNYLQFVLLFVLVFWIAGNCKSICQCLLLSSLFCFLYFGLLKTELISLDISLLFSICIGIVFGLVFGELFDGLFASVFSSIGFLIINIFVQIDMYTFAVADIYAVFSSILACVLVFIIKNLFISNLNYFRGVKCNVFKKKIFKEDFRYMLFDI